jgi:hypothetical protein
MKKLLTILFWSIAFAGIAQNLPKTPVADKKIKELASLERTPKPTTVTPCAGGSVSIPSNITGSTYQWQVNSGSGFTNITNGGIYSDVTTHTLQITGAPSSLYGYEYRCVVNGNIYSAVYTLKFVTTWTGASDNSWENPSNWNCNAVPDANTDVVINSGIPFLSTNLSARTLTLGGGANITVKTGANLTVLY